MIDAAVGGKTAVNIKSEDMFLKNVAGTFYPADKIYFWPNWLDTLPLREKRSGLGELFKMLWIEGRAIDGAVYSEWLFGNASFQSHWLIWKLRYWQR